MPAVLLPNSTIIVQSDSESMNDTVLTVWQIPANYVAFPDHFILGTFVHLNCLVQTVGIENDASVFLRVSANLLVAVFTVCACIGYFNHIW